VKCSLMLAEKKGRFLFEIRPDLFPQGFLTELETQVWADYFEERREESPNG